MSSPSDRVTRLKMAYVLYMDIVGFSLLKVGRQLSLVNELNALVRGTQEFQRAESYGDLISLPTGDGMALVFLNELEAPVLCALEIAERLRAQSQIQLRMGIHYGPIHLHEDISRNKNVVGEGINLAQRVMDCGDAGHILLSSAVAEVLSQSSEWEPCIIYLGECEIKHGLRLQVLNLVREELGNPALPTKLASTPAVTLESGNSPLLETEIKRNLRDGVELIFIPAGEFLMGSKEDEQEGSSDEKPQHHVYLDAYWIYKTPVTVKPYMAFCNAMGHPKPEQPSWGWHDDHPIVNVSWHDAKSYCDWAGVELPTEAQWEKAARGIDGKQYPWGDEWDDSKCANSVSPNIRYNTIPVTRYPQGASPYGVLDMAGNVWEWCWDFYKHDYYKTAENENPHGPNSGSYRALRGGSWSSNTIDLFRGALRYFISPTACHFNVGFRCVVRSDIK